MPEALAHAAPLGRTDARFRPLVRRDGVEGRYELSELVGTRHLLAELLPNSGGITTDIAGTNFLRDLHALRPPADGGYGLMFRPLAPLKPVPAVRRAWAAELKAGHIERLALLNYDELGTALKVVAQLIVVASGRTQTARFFRHVDDAVRWLTEGEERRAEPVDPYARTRR